MSVGSLPPPCRVRSQHRRGFATVILTLFALALLATGGCAGLGYYAQAVSGQWRLLQARQPISRMIDDPAVEPALRARLGRVRDARAWASAALQLPDNGSYRSYAELRRRYVVWNVFATAEFSLQPLEHCFLVVGCIAYQGYYDEEDANTRAAGLAADGYDVYVGGVPAYSTLGWFDDPLLSTMLHWDDATLLATLFHELAHQKLYLKNDTRFSESFAEFVGQEGLRQYAELHADLQADEQQSRGRRRAQFTKLVLATRERLATLYRQPLAPAAMRQHKAQAFADLQRDYAELRDREWGGDGVFDAWFKLAPLNNARLLPFGLYDQDAPAFMQLFVEQGRDWLRFYAAAKRLAELPSVARRTELDRLLARGTTE